MPFEDEIEELARRRRAAAAMGSARRLEEWAAKGILNARQRLTRLLDDGSFVEWGQLAVSASWSCARARSWRSAART
jgi:acetyl-CoA carboxylase carboxyltransferase component